jgi:zona occludens toxin
LFFKDASSLLNHQKFSEVTALPLDRVQELLIQINKEQVPTIYAHVEDDSLVVIDELQDFFPTFQKQLTPKITEFVTQHGHRGIDIIVMGQAHKDFNILWRRRIDTLIRFIKRDAVGRYDSYTWITHKQQNERFVKVRDGSGKYDPKYFGLYASHNAGVEAIDTHRDDKVNLLKSVAFKYFLVYYFCLPSDIYTMFLTVVD